MNYHALFIDIKLSFTVIMNYHAAFADNSHSALSLVTISSPLFPGTVNCN